MRMKIALVHDDFLQWGGAERVVRAISEIWPKAPIYTSIVAEDVTSRYFKNRQIIDTKLLRLPFRKQIRRAIFPIYPSIFQAMDFSQFDIVLSSSTRFAHMIRKTNGATHINYCHTPPRYFWSQHVYLAHESMSMLKMAAIAPFTKTMQGIDFKAAQRIDTIVSNSKNTAAKVKRYYGKQSVVVPPFVDDIFFKIKANKPENYFLVVTRLVPWKRVDIAIEACKLANQPLIIVGSGPDKRRLMRLAWGTQTKFVENLTDHELVTYYSNSKALIVTQEEDFGLTSLEAQACGTPVVAFKKGGAAETVMPNITGIFFSEQAPASLAKALKRFGKYSFNPDLCKTNAQKYTKQRFQQQLKAIVLQSWRQHAL